MSTESEEELKRVEEASLKRQQEALKNPDSLADRKDPVGDLGNLREALDADAEKAGIEDQLQPTMGASTKSVEQSKSGNDGPTRGEGDSNGLGAEMNGPTRGDGEQQVQAPNIPQQGNGILSASSFEGKGKSFFNPSTEKGFFQTLDKKIDDVLKSKDPQELMEKAFWMMLNLLFDMINAEMDHRKAEKKRLKDEYNKNTSDYDSSMGTKKSDVLLEGFKSIVDGLPSDYKQKYLRDGHFCFDNMSKSDRKNLGKIIKKDKNLFSLMQKGMSRVAKRELKSDEVMGNLNKILGMKSPLDLNRVTENTQTLSKGVRLDSPTIGTAVDIDPSVREDARNIDADTKQFSDRVTSHMSDRNAYEQVRSGRTTENTGRPFIRGRGNDGNAA